MSWFDQEESGGDRYAAKIWIGEGEPFKGQLHDLMDGLVGIGHLPRIVSCGTAM